METPSNFKGMGLNGVTPNNFKERTPLIDQTNLQSTGYTNQMRGETAPCSANQSKERHDRENSHILIKNKFNSHSNANILKFSNPQPETLNTARENHPSSGNIGGAPGFCKRSGSQKIRGNSQHFLKRKDGVKTVESQQKDIAEVLKKSEIEEKRKENSLKRAKEKIQKQVAAVKQNPPTPEKDSNIEPIEALDKVTFNIKLKDDILSERDRMIKSIKSYIRKNKRLPSTTLDYYKFVKLVGKGAFGKVTLGIHKLTGKQVAIKTIEKAYMKDDFSRKKVLQEVFILKNIKHSNVIRLLEVFESPKHLLIVMEYSGGGDLLKYIKKHGRMTEQKAREYFIQIIYGLAH